MYSSEEEEKSSPIQNKRKVSKEKPTLENLAGNLDDIRSQVDEHLAQKEGNFKQISADLSRLVHKATNLLILASNSGGEYETISCQFCQKNGTFYRIYNWTGQHRECLRFMAHEQLQYFNNIIKDSGISLLTCKDVVIPMLLLLMSLKPSDKRKVPPDIEKLYVSILHRISQRISSKQFLDLMSEDLFTNEGFKIPKFTFFELLVFYTHQSGENGHLARKGILDCINASKLLASFHKHISEESAACVIITGGLSARFSSLPMTLDIHEEDWHYITRHDLQNMSELQSFLQALDFCCVVTEASHPAMKSNIGKLIYDGFLMSVLAPALNQSQFDAQIAVMAYLDLFLRCITSTKVMEVFLKVLMTDAYDNKALITLLIYHINSESVQLSMVAIQLFKTLLELNCEDIIFHLIFRYLISCNHILPNQKRTIKSMDYYCKSATMFLYLTPSCCIETNKHNRTSEQDNQNSGNSSPRSRTSNDSPKISHFTEKENSKVNSNSSVIRKSSANSTSSLSSTSSIQPELRPQDTLDFMAYLQDAKAVISACKRDCKCWSAVYDGMDVVTENPRERKSSSKLYSSSSISSPDKAERTVSESSNDSVLEEARANEVITTEVLGPFLNAIFDKLETMIENNVYVNLLLTSLVARLASYPQPLLRSFLLNSNLVVRPGVRSLVFVLKSVSDAAEIFVTRLDDYKLLITKARQNLISRGERKNLIFPNDELPEKNPNLKYTVSLDPVTGATKYQQKEIYSNKTDKPISADELISLTSDVGSRLSVSVNTSIRKSGEHNLNRTSTISNPGSVGRLHPALPKFNPKDVARRRAYPSKSEIAEMRKKNPTLIKNAVYCVVILEEFMKELSAISIEQALQ